MDHQTQLDGATPPATATPTLTRRGFLRWARNGLVAVAGLTLLGGAAAEALTPDNAAAKESDDEDKDEKSSKKKKNESKKNDSDKSKKKKKKNKNKAQKAIANSPYGKYIVQGQDKFNCTDFTSQAEAQGTLRLVPSDPNNLDRNRDGIACGGTEAFQDGVPGGFMMPPYDINPVPRP